METPKAASLALLPAETILTDYEHWLAFVTTSRQIMRQYDRQLSLIKLRYPDLGSLSSYLRDCMHYRAQFFGRLAIHLTATVAQLRTDPQNEVFIRRLTYVHPTLQTIISDLTAAFADIDESYRQLPTVPVDTISHRSAKRTSSRLHS